MPSLEKKYHKKEDGTKSVKGYYAEFRDPSRTPSRKTVSLRTKDKTAARAKLATMEREYAQGTFDPWVQAKAKGSTVTAQQAFDRFIASRKETGSKKGVETYFYAGDSLIRTLPLGLLVSQIETKHITSWLESLAKRKPKPAAPSTLKTYSDRVRIFAAWCVENGLAPQTWSPVPKAKRGGKKSRVETPIRFFTEEQIDTLMCTLAARIEEGGNQASAVDEMLAVIVPFTAGTGLRLGEVCALTWGSVHLDPNGGMSYVRVANSESFTTKSGRERTVPLVGDAFAAIQNRLESKRSDDPDEPVFPAAKGGVMNGNYLSKRFRSLLKETGIPGTGHHNFHSLRHTFGTMAANRGVPIFQIKEIMGHADIKTTLKYAGLRPVALGQVMQKAFGAGLAVVPN